MEVKLVCLLCRKEIVHDVETTGDDVILEIYPCNRCRKVAYEKGRIKGVAEYLDAKVERRKKDGQTEES